MGSKKTSLLNNGMIWFGAGVSIAEILTGTYVAPLGMQKGLLAIIIGHIIGCTMLFLAGLIGGRTRRSSMETVKMSFGQKGSILFSILNIIQLIGWTAIMIYDGAIATKGIIKSGTFVWCIVIGLLIILWIWIGINDLGKLNTVAITGLFLLTVWLCKGIFGSSSTVSAAAGSSISFGAAVELAAAMPLSWLPLISDYTREAEKPAKATLVSVIVYGMVSCWMYVIGMGSVIFTGQSEISQIIIKAGSGIIGLLIIVFSTVTTTFMDAFSAGVSTEAISGRLSSKWVGIAVTIIGTIAAIVFPMDNIEPFLYLIGSVFAPMIAIQIADYFILKKDFFEIKFNIKNLIIWLIGFIIYRILMKTDCVIGNTLPDMMITIFICLLVNKIKLRYEFTVK